MGLAIDVLIALDEEGLVSAVVSALAKQPSIAVHTEPANVPQGAAAPLVVLVSDLAGKRLQELRRGWSMPDQLIPVVLKDGLDADEARRALVSGASGALDLSDLERTLPAAIHAAVAGLVVVSKELTNAVERPSLTTREKQILALVVMGLSNTEIAQRLVVAESTVKSHLFSAYRRLGVRNRREAITLITDPQRGLGSGILHIT